MKRDSCSTWKVTRTALDKARYQITRACFKHLCTKIAEHSVRKKLGQSFPHSLINKPSLIFWYCLTDREVMKVPSRSCEALYSLYSPSLFSALSERLLADTEKLSTRWLIEQIKFPLLLIPRAFTCQIHKAYQQTLMMSLEQSKTTQMNSSRKKQTSVLPLVTNAAKTMLKGRSHRNNRALHSRE